MKNKFFISLLCLFSLASCNTNLNSSSNISSSSSNSTSSSIPSESISSSSSSSSTSSSSTKENHNLVIYAVNDTHGRIEEDSSSNIMGLAKIREYIYNYDKDYNPDYSIFVSAGDMFQGTGVSNLTQGQAMSEIMNSFPFDAMAIGNHEFDWGLDKMHTYKDGDYSNGEADFPFLGANIYDKKTNERVSWLDPYTVVEINGLKLGIIGIIGHDLESSILYDNIKDYDFVYPLEIIKQYAKELRTELDCDAVIVSNHDYDTELNQEIARLTGDMRIDGILCGHTHQNEYDILSRSDGTNIVAVENRDKNQSATSLTLQLNKSLNYEDYKFERFYPSNYDLDAEMHAIIVKYQSVIDEGARIIGTSEGYLSRQNLGIYAVTSMKEKFSVDVAIMNTGGVRATIPGGEITVADVFEVFPFNNELRVKLNLYESETKEFLDMCEDELEDLGYSIYYTGEKYFYDNSNITYFNKEFNVSNLQNNKDYSVAVIDYVYVSTRYTEFKNTVRKDTNILLRDLVIEYIDKLY